MVFIAGLIGFSPLAAEVQSLPPLPPEAERQRRLADGVELQLRPVKLANLPESPQIGDIYS